MLPVRVLLLAGHVLAMAVCLNGMTAENLRCEYQVNPLGLDTPRPRVGWELRSDRRGAMQKAYQVLVASSPGLLTETAADMWNSGRVESARSSQIVYQGKPLASGQGCWWTVRAWDESDAPGPYAPPAYWEMGLLDPAEWHGTWIGAERRPPTQQPYATVPPAPHLRKAFSLPAAATRARAYVCGLGYYELFINGERVGDRMLDPGYTNYDKRVLYSSYDVTPLLRPGDNAIGAVLGTGWYDVHTLAVWDFDKAPWRGAPRMLLELRCELADGTSLTLVSDSTWKESDGPILFDSIYEGEIYDARREMPGWTLPGFDDSAWRAARRYDAPRGRLAAQECMPIRLCERVRPVRITQPRPGVFVADMGRNIAGVPELSAELAAGTSVTLQHGEKLGEDGLLDQRDIEVYVVKRNPAQRFQTDVYIARGTGREQWRPRFTYHGFQYIQVSGFPGELTADNIGAWVMHTAFEPAGWFHCSDALVNQIVRNTNASFLGNAHGIPTDCPTREKNGWTADAHLAAETGMFNFRTAPFYAKWMNDIDDAQTTSGQLPGIVPSGGWGYEKGIGTVWDSALFLIPWYMYQYYGDTHVLEAHYDAMKRYMDWMAREAPGGIVEFGIGDWCPHDTQTPNALTSTAYYFADAQIMARIAELLGRADDAAKYGELAHSLRAGFQARFFDPKTANCGNGSQASLACALFHGLVPDEHTSAVLARLADSIERKDFHLDCGILGAKHVMLVLLEHGRCDVAWRLATQTSQPSWGWWIAQGATTLWENWNGRESRNHIMFGDIGAWCFKALAGIVPDPAHPGMQRIVIRPHFPRGLSHARAGHHAMCGRYAAGWQIENSRVKMSVTIPANAGAEVHLPVADSAQLTESGRALAEAQGITLLRTDANGIVMQAGSGTYVFEFPEPERR